VVQAVTDALGAPVIEVPILGGSLPTALFAEALGAPLVVLPIANHDDNQHAANENLRLQNLWDGIAVFAGVEARLGAYLKH
jgi:acetylornithine deacetylase/succinyl-diaminopimelate desuccinylase-like protein